MKFLKYSWFVALLVLLLASCALPAGTWTVHIPAAHEVMPTWTPVVGGPPQATAEAEFEATATALATVEAPQEESTPEPAACEIKGNLGRNGEKIYHLPTGAYWETVKIDTDRCVNGVCEQWFCTPEQAEAAGFRKSSR